MAIRKFPCLTNEEYARTFHGYCNRTDALTGKIIQGNFEYELMIQRMKEVLEKFGDNPIDFLSIGTGDGTFEQDLQEKSGLKLGNYVCYESNTEHCKSLKKRIPTWNLKSHKLFCEGFSAKTEDPEMKFDVVYMSHVMYFMENPDKVILKVYSYLKPGGKLVIVQQGYKNSFCHLTAKFQTVADLDAKCYDEYGDNLYSDKEVCDTLADNNISYTRHTMMSMIDFTQFVEKTNTDHVSLILQTMFDNLPKDIQELIHSYTKEICTQTKDNKWVHDDPNAMVIAYN